MSEPPSVDQQHFRDALARWASGVTVLTTTDPAGHAVGMTAASFSSLSLDPPLILVCVARSAYAHDALTAAERFAVHILGHGQEELSSRFAHAGSEKFTGLPDRRDEHNLPILPAGVARLTCARHSRLDGGDHTILIGRVLGTELAGTDPLIYCNRSYHRLTT